MPHKKKTANIGGKIITGIVLLSILRASGSNSTDCRKICDYDDNCIRECEQLMKEYKTSNPSGLSIDDLFTAGPGTGGI